MSERLGIPRIVQRTAAASLLFISGCSIQAGGSGHGVGPQGDGLLPRCFEQPQPNIAPESPPPEPQRAQFNSNAAYLAASEKWYQTVSQKIHDETAIIHLSVAQTEPKRIDSDPGEPAQPLANRLRGSVVQVNNSRFNTGFLSKNPKGETVVLTAGHVVVKDKLKDIDITDDFGHTVHPTSGCVVFDEKGYFTGRNPHLFPENDAAVLTLPHTIGKDTLALNQSQPQRGQWVHFQNYQMQAQLGAQASYNGLVVESEPGFALRVTTGLEPPKDNNPENIKNSMCLPGSSGGPVVDSAGNVIGLTSAAVLQAETQSAKRLARYDRLAIEGAQGNVYPDNIVPHDCWLTRSNVLGKLIDVSVNLPHKP